MSDSRATVLLILLHADLTVREIEALHCRFCDKMPWGKIARWTGLKCAERSVPEVCYQGIRKLRKRKRLLAGWRN
jgi:hypothetical protein